MFASPPFQLDERYLVEAEIGRGAHAIVYRALDTVLHRQVAIKLLRPDVIEPGVTARFAQEIQITTKLDHPNISRVHDTGEWNGRPYFVSALATGRSLDLKIQKDAPLPVDEAVHIVVELAEALAYAHAQGIVHRDVKPDNILLTDHGALLADFGIARAVGLLNEQAIVTSTGIAVGTLLYMSPEQICAERNIDGRSDQYSLALVLYEMLTGVRPHESASIEGLRSLRIGGKQLAPHDHRPSIPAHVSAALVRALAPAPADRFVSCSDFARALSAPVTAKYSPSKSRRIPVVITLALLTIVAGLGWYAVRHRGDVPSDVGRARNGGETVRVAVALHDSSTTALGAPVVRRIQDELARWEGVTVVEAPRAFGGRAWSAFGRESIDRAVRISVTARGNDSAVLDVYNRDGDGERRAMSRVFARATGIPDHTLREVLHRLVGGAAAQPDSAPGLGTLHDPQRAALDAYVRGWRALRDGMLDSAASAFRESAMAAPRFAAGTLWYAQTLQWQFPADTARWRPEAERAAATSERLDSTDAANALALRALAHGDYGLACDTYRRVAAREPTNFVAWFGLGECQRLDRAVVVDPKSPTGYRFRANYHAAIAAYVQALERLPSARLGALFRGAARSTFATTLIYRTGRLNDESGTSMAAFPALWRDSVVFWPIPMTDFLRSDRNAIPPTYMEAIRRGRLALLQFSERWVQRADESYAAHMGRALALELSGVLANDASGARAPASLMSLSRAARLASTPAESLDVQIALTRVHLRAEAFDAAFRTADSALADRQRWTSANAARLAPLAALLGRRDAVRALAQLANQRTADGVDGLPDWLAARYATALATSTALACDDIASQLAQLDSGLATHFSPNEMRTMRLRWYVPVARLSLPCLNGSTITQLNAEVPLDRAVRAFARGERTLARAILDSVTAQRRGANASAVAWDVEYGETWLLLQLGDSTAAYTRLESGLNDLAGLSEYALDDVGPAAGLRHAVAHAARLGRAQRSLASERWERMFQALRGDSPH